MSKRTDRTGSSFDAFLEEEGLLEEVEAVAMKRVLAWQLQEAMKSKGLTKQRMARELNTSRSQVDRLLDPEYTGIGLNAVSRAAHALGKRIAIELVDAPSQRNSTKMRARRAVPSKRTA